jgi:hypothetical protein
MRENYLPFESPKWCELQELIGLKLDFSRYYQYFGNMKANTFCPAEDWAENLFDRAINGYKDICLVKVIERQKESNNKVYDKYFMIKRVDSIKKNINPEIWRSWFYGLWGQKYHDSLL